jgi:hypothetical protein
MPLANTINVAMYRDSRETLKAIKKKLGLRNDADALEWILERVVPNKKVLAALDVVHLELELSKLRDTKLGDVFLDRIKEAVREVMKENAHSDDDIEEIPMTYDSGT